MVPQLADLFDVARSTVYRPRNAPENPHRLGHTADRAFAAPNVSPHDSASPLRLVTATLTTPHEACAAAHCGHRGRREAYLGDS